MGREDCGADACRAMGVRDEPYSPDVPKRKVRRLIVDDNLLTLANLPDETVALVYLDPPFNSGRSYDLVDDDRSKGQGRTEVFRDSWGDSCDSSNALADLQDTAPRDFVELTRSLVHHAGRRELAGYIAMMAPRLVELHRVLDDAGSLYIHCDPSASHYLKVLLDQVFGPSNFRNEIVWKRTHAHSSSRRFGPVHDTLLLYTKTTRYRWNPMYSAYPRHYIDTYYSHEDENGRYQLITCTAPGDRSGTKAHYEWRGKLPPPGRHWAWKREQMESFEEDGRLVYSSNGIPRLKRYVDEAPGVQLQDIWTDINRLDAHSDERIGFETQKPVALLTRVIEASSNAGDVVLDPFLGSGSAAVAAERAGRAWIGIDRSLVAGSLALARVRQEVSLNRVELEGFPANRREALRLLRESPTAYGLWGTSLLATLADKKTRSGSLVTGSGQLRARRRLVQLKSWIPLTARRIADLGSLPRGRLSKIGFVLRADRRGSGLRERLETEFDLPVHEVPIDSLVDAEARRCGIAREVAELSAA